MNRWVTCAGLVGASTRSVVVPGPLYADVASYETTPLPSVCGLETVSPVAPAYAGIARPMHSNARIIFLIVAPPVADST